MRKLVIICFCLSLSIAYSSPPGNMPASAVDQPAYRSNIPAAEPPYSAKSIAAWMESSTTGFEENTGQIRDDAGSVLPEVLFKASAKGITVYVTTKGLTYFFIKPSGKNPIKERDISKHSQLPDEQALEWSRVDMELEGARIDMQHVVKTEPIDGIVRYYKSGSPQGMETHRYKKIVIKNIYPGIDWVLYNQDNRGMKYDFIVHPGASAERISMQYNGAEKLSLAGLDNLNIKTRLGSIQEGALLCYEKSGKKIRSAYHLEGNRITFDLADYDKNKTLVIDPPLVWATYYGGSGNSESGWAITTDISGNIYVTGETNSSDFPIKTPAGAYSNGTHSGNQDIFVLKFTSKGVLLWSTYYGGSEKDVGYGIVTDKLGSVYITGQTFSSDLPTISPTPTAYYNNARGGNTDAFVLKFDKTGVQLWSTYFGGTDWDAAADIDVDGGNNVYIVGHSSSNDLPLKDMQNSSYYQDSIAGAGDGFITKFNSSCVLQWSTFYGGQAGDFINAIEIDQTNNMYITGISNSLLFPTKKPVDLDTYYQPVPIGSYDAFIIKFSPAAVVEWGTMYGGGLTILDGGFAERGMDITTDIEGNVYVVGETDAKDFPVLEMDGAFFQKTNKGGVDAFLLKFSTSGERLWATYYGGAGDDGATGITSPGSDIFLTGYTGSADITTYDPGYCSYFSAVSGGSQDIFLLRFNSTGGMTWGTYYGGLSDDVGTDITTDGKGFIYVTGRSSSLNFPTENPGPPVYYQGLLSGAQDAVILKLGAPIPDAGFTSNIVCVGDTTFFLDTSFFGDLAYQCLWNFGDPSSGLNNISTEKNPAHVFSSSGTFSVRLTITDLGGCGISDFIIRTVTVNERAAVSAGPDTAICPGTSVTLAGTRSGSTTSVGWASLGTGSFNNASLVNAVYTPSANDITAGKVTLIIKSDDPAGPCPAVSDTMELTFRTPDDPSFTYPSSTYCQKASTLPVITGLKGGSFSSGPGLSINPNTGMVDLGASALGDHTITYTTNGVCPASTTFTIGITTVPDPSFSYDGPYCNNFSPMPSPKMPSGSTLGTFSAAPGGLVFASNATGQLNIPASAPGTYTVTNTIAATQGCPVITSKNTVTVIQVPKSTFSVASTACLGRALAVTYTGNALSTANYTWDFSDGSIVSGTDQGPYTISYDTPGHRAISLSVTENGCTSSVTLKNVTVNEVPSAAITNPEDTIYLCPGQNTVLNFSMNGTGPWTVVYEENGFNKSFTTSNNTYALNVTAKGSYVLTKASALGCDSVLNDIIYIDRQQQPTLTALVDKNAVCKGDEVEVTITLGGSQSLFDAVIDGGKEIFTGIKDQHKFRFTVNNDTSFSFTTLSYANTPQCPRNLSVPVNIKAYDAPVIGNISFNCNPVTALFQVSFDIYEGDAASYTVNGMPAASSYISPVMASGTTYKFTVTDQNNCDPVTISDIYRCNCSSEAGTALNTNPLDLCENLTATYPHNGKHFLDETDTLEFLLHDGNDAAIGTVLSRNNTGAFTFNPALKYNTTYYITPIAGNHKGSGEVNMADSCMDSGVGIPVIFRRLPGISIAATPNDSICLGDTAHIITTFTGDGPFDVTYNDGTLNHSLPAMLSGGRITLPGLTANTTYTFVSVTSAYCSSSTSKALTIYLPKPFTVDASISPIRCLGEKNGGITTAITGGFGGYRYEWQNSSGIMISASAQAANLGRDDYFLTVTDKLGCTVSADYTLTDPPLYRIGSVSVVNENCFQSNDGQVHVYAPDGKLYSITSVRPWQTDSSFALLHYKPGLDSLKIEVESDKGCKADTIVKITGLYPIVLNRTPDQLVCPGTSVDMQISASGGNGNFAYFWDGARGDPAKTITPTALANKYEVYATDEKNCPSAKETIIIDLPSPLTQASSKDLSSCYGNIVRLTTAPSGGTGAYTSTWSDIQGNVLCAGASYETPALLSGSYIVSTSDTCGTVVYDTVNLDVVQPIDVAFKVRNDSIGCVPFKATFINQSQGDYDRIEWSTNNITYTNTEQYTYTFDTPGIYDVSLKLINTRGGCSFSTTKKSYITVHPRPTAAFDYFPKELTVLAPDLVTKNLSENAASYNWTLDEVQVSETPEPSISLSAMSDEKYRLCLEAVTAEGCNDLSCKTIVVKGDVAFYIPNSFSPNGDGNNDIFKVHAIGTDPNGFYLQVFDRWGELIFHTRDIDNGWDGQYRENTVKSGIYSWRIEIQVNGELQEKFGHVTLLR